MMSAAVSDRSEVQPWKPKSRQKPGLQCQEENVITHQELIRKPRSPHPHRPFVDAIDLYPFSPPVEPRAESPNSRKHPLQNRWSMWYYKNDKQKDWKSNQRLIASCDTVEDFWALFNHLKPPSALQAGCDYSFFKEGIEPMWEDPRNVEGGRWLINLQRQQRNCDLDRFWQETLMCLVGEIFDPFSDEVLGAVVNIRAKGDKLAIWTADAEKKSQILNIGKNMRLKLNVPRHIQIEFQAHKDTSSKSGSTTKKRHTV